MKVKVSELSGAALDWAVAYLEKQEIFLDKDAKSFMCLGEMNLFRFSPTKYWAQGGPIIERGLNNLFKHNQLDKSKPPVWCAVINVPSEHGTMLLQYDGPTPLIAAMRCFVASKLGEEVEIPKELL